MPHAKAAMKVDIKSSEVKKNPSRKKNKIMTKVSWKEKVNSVYE